MKKPFKLFILVLFSFMAILHTSCYNDGDDDNSSSNCANIACTEEFVTIVISIEHQNQNPVVLDSFEVINTENGSDVTILISPSGFEMAQQSGQYPLATDGVADENQELQLQFKGYINGKEVIVSNYTVSADCCHIDLVSGDLQLIL